MLEFELVRKEDKGIIDKAEKFFEPLHRGHSHFQIENFILNDEEFPLPDDKYYQGMLEAYSRYENLIGQHYEHRKLANEIKLLEFDIEDINNGAVSEGRRRVYIDIKQDEIAFKRIRMRNIERAVKDICREINSFLICMDKVKDKMKYSSYEGKEKHHWLLVHNIQKKKGRPACKIPESMLLEQEAKKILEVT